MIDTWKPTVKQEKFLALPLTFREGFYAGAMGAGKSDVLLMYPIVHGWFQHSQFKGLFLRRTYTELKNEIIPRSRDYFRPTGATYNATDKIWTFPRLDQYGGRGGPNDGALFYFGHCEHEDDVHNYDSMQPNYVAFDELTSFTEWQYLYITFERCRVTKELELEGLPQICRSASNPGNIGHVWVRKRFIDPAPLGHKALRNRAGAVRIFIPATVEDNPHQSEQYIRELESLPEAERRAKKYGDWSAYEGQVFTEFRDRRYPDEPENALHVIEPFTIPNFWPKLVAIDWGKAAMTYICYGAISPSRRLYIYREQVFDHGEDIEIWAPFVLININQDEPKEIVICSSANQHRGQPMTVMEQVELALNRKLSLSTKDRISSKTLLHEYFRWRMKEIIPQKDRLQYEDDVAAWILRNKGVEEYKLYLRQFETPKVEDNLPKLQIFNTCPTLINTIKACVYAKSSDNTVAEDVAEWNGDDPYDDIRYLVTIADRYFDESIQEMHKVEQKQQIVQQFQMTQDMTAFYRNMAKADREDAGPKPISRYHNRHFRVH